MGGAMGVKSFKFLGYDAYLCDGRIEISLPDEELATQIVLKLANSILDGKFKSLRINLPGKIIFIGAKDKDHLKFRAEHANDRSTMN